MSSPTSPQQHEPTMEEILASIRKIISEDQAEPAAPAQAAAPKPVPLAVAPAPTPAPAPEPEEEEQTPPEADVLDLTHEVREEPAAPVVAAAPAPAPANEDMRGSAVADDDVMFATVEETHAAPAGDELISDSARRAMSRAFEPYDESPREVPSAQTAMTPVEGGQLEAVFMRAVAQSFNPVLRDWMGKNTPMVVSHMKPLIREWMDENLPDLIERAVKSEMAAAVRAITKKR